MTTPIPQGCQANQAMLRKLEAGRCIDVSGCRRTVAGDYILDNFVDGSDYCDAKAGTWIRSIGRLLRPLPSVMADGSRETLLVGTFIASTAERFWSPLGSTTYHCVWLR